MRISLIALALGFSSLALGGSLVKMTKSQRSILAEPYAGEQFKKKQIACVYQFGSRVACGRVTKVTKKGAVIKLLKHQAVLSVGDEVQIVRKRKKRSIAAIGEEQYRPRLKMKRKGKRKRVKFLNDFTIGMNGSLGLVFPVLHFQRIIGDKIAVGIAPGVLSSSTQAGDAKLSAFGLQAMVNYYSKGYFSGWWFSGGLGPYFFSATSLGIEEKTTSLALTATAGWRSQWNMGINVGIAGGFQYTGVPESANFTFDFAALRPLVLVDFGFNF